MNTTVKLVLLCWRTHEKNSWRAIESCALDDAFKHKNIISISVWSYITVTVRHKKKEKNNEAAG